MSRRGGGRVLLLLPVSAYRASDFLEAARRLDVEVLVGTDRAQALESAAPGGTIALDFADTARAVVAIVALARERPFDAVVATDDETTVLAAAASEALGLPAHPAGAARAARDKSVMRERLREAGVPAPRFEVVSLEEQPEGVAARMRYPCVLKPLSLSASRGVIRADDPAGFAAAFRRIAALLADPEVASRPGGGGGALLVEEFLAGPEFALEGLMTGGRLRVLALFDKPDPLDGPFFEETIYVTPSRLPAGRQQELSEAAAAGARALGMTSGPVHAELRLTEAGPRLIEIAPRSIGGLCSRALRFGLGVSLEELILAHATGRDVSDLVREPGASGVMMIPIPAAGVLEEVAGVEEAKAVEGIAGVVISIPSGQRVVPLPEGNRYLGFLFAKGPDPERVEAALREAHRRLRFRIVPPGVRRGAPPPVTSKAGSRGSSRRRGR